MTDMQIFLFALLGLVFAMLIWGRVRYDLVALGALVIAVIGGAVPTDEAFSGFGHPATIIIALVLVVSRGLSNSGAVDVIARLFIGAGRSVSIHIATMAGVGAAMSALMNNVGALALLMPVDLQAAERADRSPAITLMPLSFATILGGLITLIGTPPNIIISSYRAQELGEPFRMFDFAPVGVVCALTGVAFVALIGWRLLPKATRERAAGQELFDTGSYLVEVRVPEGSKTIGKTLQQIDEICDARDVAVVAVLRRGARLPSYARWLRLEQDDVLLVEARANTIDSFVNDLDLDYAQEEEARKEPLRERARRIGQEASRQPKAAGGDGKRNDDDGGRASAKSDGKSDGAGRGELSVVEAVVRPGAFVEGRTAQALRLHDQYGVWLIGISREGRKITTRVRHMTIRAGDILLMLGPPDRLSRASEWLGALPLAARGLQVTNRTQAALAGGIFAGAILLASFGFLYLSIALAAVVVLYALLNIVPPRTLYDSIEWPVVVLIGSLLPIGAALERSGGTELIAQGIVDLSTGAPPWVVLTLLMAVTMTLSDILNNTATAVIAAPIAVGVAKSLGVNPDPFLMAVAIAASCAFLTPIGHKNNTLIMGPGGYRFGDYWRMGLPLEIVVIAVAVPMILIVWPL